MATRRAFLQGSASALAVLSLPLPLNCLHKGKRHPEAPKGDFVPNIWLKVHGDGRATLTLAKSEMGQGVRTALPMILADELELPWDRVQLEQARPGKDFQSLSTGGSTSVTTLYEPLRQAAAAAREMLVSAAARRWGVEPSTCAAELGAVVHLPTKRHLTYGELVGEASTLPVPEKPTLKKPEQFRYIGRPMKRFQGQDLLTGKALFASDFTFPGLKVAVVTRCPVMGGAVKRANLEEVTLLPGVCAVVKVSTGVAVLADHAHQALRAAELLKIEWDLGPHRTFDTDRYRQQLQDLFTRDRRPAVVQDHAGWEQAMAGAARKIEAEYEFPFQAHAPLETPCAIAHAQTDGCEIWVGSQNPNAIQDRVAKLMNLAPERVKVNVLLMGGGFGRRLAWDFPLEAVEVSRVSGHPVKVIWTRKQDLAHDWYHPMSLHRFEGALDDRGKLTAWRHRLAAPSILLSWREGARRSGIAESETKGADLPYAVPAVRLEYLEAPLHLRLGWWRAIQAVPNTFARECFLDEMALAAGKDPLVFRLELLAAAPKPTQEGAFDPARLRGVLELAAEKAGWGSPWSESGPFRRSGRGIACTAFHDTYIAEVAEVSVDKDGRIKVERVTVATDCARVVNPLNAKAQIEGGVVWGLCALRTQSTWKEGRAQQTGYSDFPVLTLEGMPPVEAHFVEREVHPTGLGEPPVLPAIPAVLNALAAATGERVRRLPLPPDRWA